MFGFSVTRLAPLIVVLGVGGHAFGERPRHGDCEGCSRAKRAQETAPATSGVVPVVHWLSPFGSAAPLSSSRSRTGANGTGASYERRRWHQAGTRWKAHRRRAIAAM